MPGAIPLHGYATSTTAQGEGGAARVASHSAGFSNVAFPENVSFFVWLVIIGVLIPALVIGGLRAGRFQFVFRGR
jgi:hypothetical protein